MIITKLFGGLGNQLFQYSIGRVLALRHNTELYLDLKFYEQDYCIRPLSIINFNIAYRNVTEKEYDIISKKNQGWLVWKINNQYQKLLRYNKRNYIKEKTRSFDQKILKAGSNVILDGYWQSERYFKSAEEEIRKELTLKKKPENKKFEPLAEEIGKALSVSIHVRRGDYLDHQVPLCSMEYYRTAMQYISRSSDGKAIFYIFSDDIAWCRENFRAESGINYIEKEYGFADQEELILMSYCKHHIISNSTFGWWGAWLSKNKNKIVCYPEVASVVLNKDLMLPDWKCI